MPLGSHTTAKDQGHRNVIYMGDNGRTYGAKVEKMSTRAATPAAPTAGTATTGGTLAPATYSYRLSKIIDGVETLASTAVTQVVPAGTNTNVVNLSWSNDANAQAYRVYGRVGGSEQLIAERPAGSTAYQDTGAVTPSGTVPAALPNTAVHLRILGRSGPYQKLLGGVLPATAEGQTDRYYVR
jgi:hypothetical protein